MSADHDAGVRAGAGEQPAQRVGLQRHASGGRREARPGDMHEHGAAAAGDTRPGVVVELDDEVVETIGALQPVAGGPAFSRIGWL